MFELFELELSRVRLSQNISHLRCSNEPVLVLIYIPYQRHYLLHFVVFLECFDKFEFADRLQRVLHSMKCAKVPCWVFCNIILISVLDIDLSVSFLLLLVELLLEYHSDVNSNFLTDLPPRVSSRDLLLLLLTQSNLELLEHLHKLLEEYQVRLICCCLRFKLLYKTVPLSPKHFVNLFEQLSYSILMHPLMQCAVMRI